MSRPRDELEYRLPDAPRAGRSVRAALSDFYFNSWRLVPANVIWGAGLLLSLLVGLTWPLGGLLLVVLLALPTVGIFRMAALIVRGQAVSFGDALTGWRRFVRPALITGVVVVAITVVLLTNILLGFASAEPLGWAIATAAGWGLLATWAVALPLWPLLVDPLRAEAAMSRRVRLATAVVLVAPGRYAAVLAIVVIIFVVSTVLFAALITISVAFIALVLSRYTLPAADRLENRPTEPIYR